MIYSELKKNNGVWAISNQSGYFIMPNGKSYSQDIPLDATELSYKNTIIYAKKERSGIWQTKLYYIMSNKVLKLLVNVKDSDLETNVSNLEYARHSLLQALSGINYPICSIKIYDDTFVFYQDLGTGDTRGVELKYKDYTFK